MVDRQIIFISLIPTIFGIALLRRANWFLTNGKRVEATVIGNNTEIDSEDGSTSYFPIIRFLTFKNETITLQLDSSSHYPHLIGKRISIIYNADNPKDYTIDLGRRKMILVPKLLLVAGIAGIIVATLDILEIISIEPLFNGD